MDLRIDNIGLELPVTGTATIEHRAQRALGRFEPHLVRLWVTLRDDNGPRGGQDKVCTLRLELGGGGQVIVVTRSSNLNRAIARSLRRGRTLVARELRRRRATARRRPQAVPGDLIGQPA